MRYEGEKGAFAGRVGDFAYQIKPGKVADVLMADSLAIKGRGVYRSSGIAGREMSKAMARILSCQT